MRSLHYYVTQRGISQPREELAGPGAAGGPGGRRGQVPREPLVYRSTIFCVCDNMKTGVIKLCTIES